VQEQQPDLVSVLRAIAANTAAVTQLAYATMALVRAMADEPEQDQEQMTYIDGRPIG
jgi:hypothetical protein